MLASDSFTAVLDKLTASDANVTAAYDVDSEKIVLTQKTAGPVPTITVANDTAGFLVEMNLDTAVAMPGVDGFSYTDGSFEVNGVSIDVLASDSLTAVLDKITASDAGVTAYYDSDTQRVILTQKTGGSLPGITFANDTTGFLVETNLDTAVVTPGHEKIDVAFIDGSFEVNGVSIDVLASDSLDNVLDKITASDANVTADYDTDTQRVILTQKTGGSLPGILLANDTAEFFPQAKLDTAILIAGVDDAVNIQISPLSSLSNFSAVKSGTIKINGREITLDVDTDLLTDILDRIDTSTAGVTTGIDFSPTKIFLQSQKKDKQLVIDSNATELFAALSIRDATYSASKGRKGVSRRYATQIADHVDKASQALNNLFNTAGFSTDTMAYAGNMRKDIQSSVADAFGKVGLQFKTDFGIDFDFKNSSGKTFDFSALDQEVLEKNLYKKIDPVLELFSGHQRTEEGLLDRMIKVLDKHFSNFNLQGKTTGSLVDVFT